MHNEEPERDRAEDCADVVADLDLTGGFRGVVGVGGDRGKQEQMLR